MAKSTGRRGYNAYLKAAKRKFGVTHQQARKMYRLASIKAGGPVNSRELTKHPIVSKRFAAIASAPPAKTASKRSVSSKREPSGTRSGGSATPSKRGSQAPAKSSRRATTIRQWEDWYDQADEYEDLILNAGVDTGKKGK